MARILVVEDNAVMASAIQDVLELAGHQVSIAQDGLVGLESIPKVAPELIISDVMMPRMDGFQFYEAVRSNPAWVFIPFIFLTAKGQDEDIYLGKRLGADDYLVKPYSPDNLVATVESKLTRAKVISRAAGAEMEGIKRSITRVVGHELRTPLTWIQGYADLLLGSAEGMSAEELRTSLESIKVGSDRLARLVESSVLAITLDSGQAAEEYAFVARVDGLMGLYVQQAVDLLQDQATRRNVHITVDLPCTFPQIRVAPRYLFEAFVRIIENSIKFSRPGSEGQVAITAELRDGEAEIIIADNGVGIAQEQLNRIFAPLVQIERALQEQQGIGLGLSVARGLIQLHGGRVWADSVKGEGTRVHVVLPVASAEDDLG